MGGFDSHQEFDNQSKKHSVGYNCDEGWAFPII